MATSGVDKRVKVFDLRSKRLLNSTRIPVGSSSLAFSQRGLLASALGNRVQVSGQNDMLGWAGMWFSWLSVGSACCWHRFDSCAARDFSPRFDFQCKLMHNSSPKKWVYHLHGLMEGGTQKKYIYSDKQTNTLTKRMTWKTPVIYRMTYSLYTLIDKMKSWRIVHTEWNGVEGVLT